MDLQNVVHLDKIREEKDCLILGWLREVLKDLPIDRQHKWISDVEPFVRKHSTEMLELIVVALDQLPRDAQGRVDGKEIDELATRIEELLKKL